MAGFSTRLERNQWVDFVFFLFIFAGCSRLARDKLLRVFIDGVPPSKGNLARAAGSGVILVPGIEVIATVSEETAVFFHPPYSENQCDSCHNIKSSQQVISKGKDMCFACHEDFTKDKKVVHYPVSEGSCIECHDPHQSRNKFILKETLPQICFNCHDEKNLNLNPAHEGQNYCLECHDPHASNEEKLLK